MACVANYGEADLELVRVVPSVVNSLNCSCLHPWRKRRKRGFIADVNCAKARTHRVQVEEWVLSVVDSGDWRSQRRPISSVANCGQVPNRSLLLDFNSLKPMRKLRSLVLTQRCEIPRLLLDHAPRRDQLFYCFTIDVDQSKNPFCYSFGTNLARKAITPR